MFVLQKQAGLGLTTYATVAEAEVASGVDKDLIFVVETETIYRYLAAGSGYTDDNTYVLSTGDGGNTRWIGTAGRYHYGPADSIELQTLGTPTYDDLNDWINIANSAGLVSGGTITDAGSGQINVATGTGLIRTSDSAVGQIVAFDWSSASGVTLTDDETNWVYIDYNAGSPQVAITTDLTAINSHTELVLGRVYRDGTTVKIIQIGQTISDYFAKVTMRDLEVGRGATHWHVSGLEFSEAETRYLIMSAGVYYSAHERQTAATINTASTDTYTGFYRDGVGGWVTIPGYSQVDNTLWDYGGGLTPLYAGDFGIHWVYLDHEGDLYLQWGQGSYSSTIVGVIEPPDTWDYLKENGTLVAKIIVQQGQPYIVQIAHAWQTVFTPKEAVPKHNELSNLAWSVAGHTINTDVSFAGFQALAMTAHSDVIANIPIGGYVGDGQWFYATDIETLFFYVGGWNPIISFADVDIYVDSALGGDAANKGYGSGTSAINQMALVNSRIPKFYGGDVRVYVTGVTYDEVWEISNKRPVGSFQIYIYGTPNVYATTNAATSYTSGDAPTGVRGTITVGGTWTLNELRNKVAVHDDGAGTISYYLIYGNTTGGVITVYYTVGVDPTGDTLEIRDWSGAHTRFDDTANTATSNITITNSDVYIYDCEFYNGCYATGLFSNVRIYGARSYPYRAANTNGGRIRAGSGCIMGFFSSYYYIDASCPYANIPGACRADNGGTVTAYGSYIHQNSGSVTGRGIQVVSLSVANVTGTVIDGWNIGGRAQSLSMLSSWNALQDWNNCVYGIDLLYGGRIQGAEANKFSGNTYDIRDRALKVSGGVASLSYAHIDGYIYFEPQATVPPATKGNVYFDSTTNKLRCYDGTAWQDLF